MTTATALGQMAVPIQTTAATTRGSGDHDRVRDLVAERRGLAQVVEDVIPEAKVRAAVLGARGLRLLAREPLDDEGRRTTVTTVTPRGEGRR